MISVLSFIALVKLYLPLQEQGNSPKCSLEQFMLSMYSSGGGGGGGGGRGLPHPFSIFNSVGDCFILCSIRRIGAYVLLLLLTLLY